MVRLAFYETSFGSQMLKEGAWEQTKVEAERQVIQTKGDIEPKRDEDIYLRDHSGSESSMTCDYLDIEGHGVVWEREDSRLTPQAASNLSD